MRGKTKLRNTDRVLLVITEVSTIPQLSAKTGLSPDQTSMALHFLRTRGYVNLSRAGNGHCWSASYTERAGAKLIQIAEFLTANGIDL